jgi:hypothetical protein
MALTNILSIFLNADAFCHQIRGVNQEFNCCSNKWSEFSEHNERNSTRCVTLHTGGFENNAQNENTHDNVTTIKSRQIMYRHCQKNYSPNLRG